MFLKNVKVNNFKVLKNIDIEFNEKFTPTIFPLASLNGGGKSTLLQLIFILLHTSFTNSKIKKVYLRNMLESMKIENDIENFIEFKFIDNKKEFFIKFHFANENYENFDILKALEVVEEELHSGDYVNLFEETINIFENKDDFFLRFKNKNIRHSPRNLYDKKLAKIARNADRNVRELYKVLQDERSEKSFENFIKAAFLYYDTLLNDYQNSSADLKEHANIVYENLHKNNLTYCIDCSEKIHLLYETNFDKPKLEELSSKVFLVAPNTQVFTFLSKTAKDTLFSTNHIDIDEDVELIYDYYVAQSKKNIKNFFTYEFASPDLIIKSFENARNKDFAEALETDSYGKNFNILKNDLSNFLLDKNITVNSNLDRVIFTVKSNGKELKPEDLSHGELKKLGLFIWLTYHSMNDSIILMDEVENGLHPDWQYSIVDELSKWAKSNQFILATHSYELCQALTPSHIIELNPKLFNKS